jgi:hypothetical protein
MFNIIVASLVTGVITASGAHYLSQVETHSVSVSEQYVHQAHDRFDEYNKILPGIVDRQP